MKHTPGPWEVQRGRVSISVVTGQMPSADVFRDGLCDDKDRDAVTIANATLMAAAPDLLEACKTMISSIDGSYAQVIHAKQMLEKAIAKAEGKS